MAARASFGRFELDLESGALTRDGVPVRLQPQPARVLVLLVRQAGATVPREALRQQVWPDGTFVDFERGLNFCIAQVRSALGDSADSPRFIETLPKRGYRFIAPVRPTSGEPQSNPGAAASGEPQSNPGATSEEPRSNPGAASGEPQSNPGAASGEPQSNPGATSEEPQSNPGATSEEPQSNLGATSGDPRSNLRAASELPRRSTQVLRTVGVSRGVIVAALAVFAMVIVALVAVTQRAVRVDPAVRVAVVPFDNETGMDDFDRIARGVADATVARLATPTRIGRISVIGNAAALHQPRRFRDLKRIGLELGADYIVLAQMKRDAAQVRLIAHLIRVADEAHVWANTFDAPEFTLDVQSRIAEAIAASVTTVLASPPSPRTRS